MSERLTKEEIENIRRNGVHAIRFSERADKVIELCDLALSALDREPDAVAWIATKGDDVLYFSKHDGWNVEAVLAKPIEEGHRE